MTDFMFEANIGTDAATRRAIIKDQIMLQSAQGLRWYRCNFDRETKQLKLDFWRRRPIDVEHVSCTL